MTSLPPGVKPLGLGPRKFRSSAQELGDRSVWTDTPADRIMKAQVSTLPLLRLLLRDSLALVFLLHLFFTCLPVFS